MTMRIDIATLFPEMCEAVLGESIIGRARKAGKLEIHCHNIRDYSKDKHRRVDDTPYGGGKGMLMQTMPIYDCFEAVCAMTKTRPHVIYMSPKGQPFCQQKALELLDIFNLKEYANQPASSLPYGQQRKLEIARALATDMKVLLLDEPAAGMNPTETAELVECISIVRERFGIAILLIEHDMSLVMKLCERITVIDYGQTIAEGGPEEIANNPRVIAAYLGENDEEEGENLA